MFGLGGGMPEPTPEMIEAAKSGKMPGGMGLPPGLGGLPGGFGGGLPGLPGVGGLPRGLPGLPGGKMK
jgi:signal recognition particle subunit SRP54